MKPGLAARAVLAGHLGWDETKLAEALKSIVSPLLSMRKDRFGHTDDFHSASGK